MSLSKSEQDAFVDFEKSGWEAAADPYHAHWGPLSSQSAESDAQHSVRWRGHGPSGCGLWGRVRGGGSGRARCQCDGTRFSAAQVDLAGKTVPNARFVEGSAEVLPFDDATFDAVVMGSA